MAKAATKPGKPAGQQAQGGKGGAKGGGKKGRGAQADAQSVAAEAASDIPEETGPTPTPRMKTRYREDVLPKLMQRFSYTNPYQAPRLEKIVVNMGVGEATGNIRLLEAATADLQTITGQKPSIRRARKSIANFKLREGVPVGAKVTLRGNRMWEFYDRLVSIALPRIRDFRGVSPKSFDGRGNYTLGVTEQIIFPEIDYDKVEKIRGMDITIVTSARTDEESLELLRLMQMPFRQR
jgi:large subunit ribosomal protein L5